MPRKPLEQKYAYQNPDIRMRLDEKTTFTLKERPLVCDSESSVRRRPVTTGWRCPGCSMAPRGQTPGTPHAGICTVSTSLAGRADSRSACAGRASWTTGRRARHPMDSQVRVKHSSNAGLAALGRLGLSTRQGRPHPTGHLPRRYARPAIKTECAPDDTRQYQLSDC